MDTSAGVCLKIIAAMRHGYGETRHKENFGGVQPRHDQRGGSALHQELPIDGDLRMVVHGLVYHRNNPVLDVTQQQDLACHG
jgi:hypothetical protein